MTNFYKRFIKNFNKITVSFTKLLKSINAFVKKSHYQRNSKFKFRMNNFNSFFNKKIAQTFNVLKKAFIIVSVFRYFDSIKLLKIKTNAFNKTINVIFC